MPDPLQSREIGIGAAIPEAPIPVGPLTPEQQARAKIREELRKSTEPSPLAALQEAAKAVRKPAAGTFERLVDNNIGIERRADGTRNLTAQETLRKNTALRYETLARQLSEVGYDVLPAADKVEARNFVSIVLSSWPEIAAILPPAGPDRDAIFEGILKDQRFLEKLRVVYAEATSDSKKLDSSAIEAAKKSFDESKTLEDQKKAEKTKAETDLKTAETELKKFVPGKTKALELDKATKRQPKLQAELETKQDDLDQTNDDIETLKVGRRHAVRTGAATAAFDAQIAALTPGKRKLETEIEKINVEMAKKTALEQEKSGLETRKSTLTEKLNALKPELEAAAKSRLSAQAEFAGLKFDRAHLEQAFADSLRNIIPEATIRYLETNVKISDEKRQELLKQEMEKTKDKVEKALLYQMQIRFTREDGSLIQGTIRGDYDHLKNRDPLVGGPKRLIRDYLDQEVAAGRLTASERDEKLNDPAWVTSMSPKVAEELLRQYVKMGQLKSGEAEYIIGTDWGKGVITNALAKNESVMNELEKLREKGVIKGSPLEFLRRLKGPSLLRLLIILLGGAAALGIGGPMLLKTLSP